MVSAEKSQELGCDAGDIGCLCTNQDFIYGLRDCSAAICNSEQAAQVLNYGLEICRRKFPRSQKESRYLTFHRSWCSDHYWCFWRGFGHGYWLWRRSNRY
jgi:hypothetical protein